MNQFIGIDPDVEKSGVAVFLRDNEKRRGVPIKGQLELANMGFFELYEYLHKCKKNSKNANSFRVYVECGFLNRSNWHKNNGSNAVNAQIGQRTGANHEVAKKICEMCDYLGLDYEKVKPTNSKVKHDSFKKLTGVIRRTNQEQRDAAMLLSRVMF